MAVQKNNNGAPALDREMAKVLAAVLTASGEPIGEVGIVRSGEQITLPEGMEIPEAIKWLQRKDQEENTVVNFIEDMQGFPLDCARALGLAVKKRFGFSQVSDFWPTSVGLETDSDGNTEQVYIGKFNVPTIEGGSITTQWCGPTLLRVHCNVKQKDRQKVQEIVQAARKMLVSDSVYRGKAFELEYQEHPHYGLSPKNPHFMKLGKIGQLQVNDDTFELLQSSVWTPIMRTERVRSLGIPLKRGILLEGPYGTGKSLFASETAAIAHKHGWTFIYLKQIEHLALAYEFARQYQPSVLFAEDIDTVLEEGELPDEIRNTIDGVNTKGSEVIMILTTNHADKLPKSLLRPGRLDAAVPMRAPDAKTAAKLIRQYAGSLLKSGEDLVEVGRKLDGKIPAVIREVVERAKLQMVFRSATDTNITQIDLIRAADSMEHQLKMMERETPKTESFAEQFGGAIGKQAGQHMATALFNIKNGQPAYYGEMHENHVTRPNG